MKESRQAFKEIVNANNYLNSYEMIFDFFEKLIPRLKERDILKKECIAKNYTEARIYEEVNKKFSRINIFIDNVTEFVKIIYEKKIWMVF